MDNKINTEILERAIIGCILMNDCCMSDAVNGSMLEPDDFNHDLYKNIFQCMWDMGLRNRKIDTILLCHEIGKNPDLKIDEIEILQIANECPNISNLEHYILELHESRG